MKIMRSRKKAHATSNLETSLHCSQSIYIVGKFMINLIHKYFCPQKKNRWTKFATLYNGWKYEIVEEEAAVKLT